MAEVVRLALSRASACPSGARIEGVEIAREDVVREVGLGRESDESSNKQKYANKRIIFELHKRVYCLFHISEVGLPSCNM